MSNLVRIYIDSKYVIFEYGGRVKKALTGHITNVTAKLQDIHNEKMFIEVYVDNKSLFRFPFDRVEVPYTDTADNLVKMIQAYNLSNGRELKFIAEANQTLFESSVFLPSEFSGFINGALNTNFFRTDGYRIIYSGPSFLGYEEVTIKI